LTVSFCVLYNPYFLSHVVLYVYDKTRLTLVKIAVPPIYIEYGSNYNSYT